MPEQPKQQNEYELYQICPHCGNHLYPIVVEKEKVKACANCDFRFWTKSKPVVSIILHKDDKILLLKRVADPFKGYWMLPGGYLNYTENAENAIRRTVLEEVGVEIKIENILGTYLIDNDPRNFELDITFTGISEYEIQLNNEGTSWQYVAPDTLPEHIAFKHREAIADWVMKKQPKQMIP